ncbi:MAG: GTP-binding protein [Candidatus Altiarchaeales archaeon]|nr:GTP-binding protein [Candidatus Altiarchaeales archaeon]
MSTIEDKIKKIEEEIRTTEYNKATQHHIGKLKAKLAQLREEQIKRASAGGSGLGFALKKHGDATVVLVGFPSVGKSTLLNQLTNAESPVAAYEFTTLEVIPGMMNYKKMNIQILDMPGVITGAATGKGRGKEVLSTARNSDLVLIMIDAEKPRQIERILEELYQVGIRLDQRRPNISIKKTDRSGIKIMATTQLRKVEKNTVVSILNTYGIHNADVAIREDINEDQMIDAIAENRAYIPSLVVVNKIDLVNPESLAETKKQLKKDFVVISAEKGLNLDALREKIYQKLDLMRVYLKKQGVKADLEEPLIVKRGSKIEDVCSKLHSSFKDNFLYAKVWGKSAKYPGQRKGLDHVLEEGDIVNIIKSR